jgi:F0F1-type ATP synthase assembly protein I
MLRKPLLIMQAVMVLMFVAIGFASLTMPTFKEALPGSYSYWFAGVLFVYAFFRGHRVWHQLKQQKEK